MGVDQSYYKGRPPQVSSPFLLEVLAGVLAINSSEFL